MKYTSYFSLSTCFAIIWRNFSVPPKLNPDMGSFNPETIELELPESHLEALLLFVASRANTPLGMVNEFNAGNNYASKFEMECARLEQFNMQIDHSTSNHRLIRNGWV